MTRTLQSLHRGSAARRGRRTPHLRRDARTRTAPGRLISYPLPLALRCPFCDHNNGASAKFCSECGSPLHLQPCGHCSAINHRSDACCYHCGAALADPVASSAAETAAVDPESPPEPGAPESASARESGAVVTPAWAREDRSSHPAADAVPEAPADPPARDTGVTPASVTAESAVVGTDAGVAGSASSMLGSAEARRPGARRWGLALGLFVALGLAAYFVGRSSEIAQVPSASQTAAGATASGESAIGVASPPPAAAAAQTAPATASSAPAARVAPATNPVAAQPPATLATRAAERQRATSPPDPLRARPASARPPALARECSDAVAAIGLCAPETKYISTKTP